ncbi:MAG: hypothetical protein GY870_05670, partial [archaeon]|nr:hypothetical protein [archaeon]
MDKKNNQDIEYKCDVCGELFPEELVNNYILKNRKVYCEKCGSQFRTDLKNEMKSKSQRRKSKKSTRAKRPIKQTVRSKRSYSPPSPPSPPAPPITRQKDIIITPSFKTLKSARQKTSESNLNSLRSVINVLDFIIKYQFFIFIGSLVTIFRLAGVAIFWSITPIFGNIGNIIDIIVRLIMLIIINRYAIEKVSRKVSEGDFSNFGIDAIVIGILGMGCYGMGGVILAEGIIILIHEFLIRENNLIEQIKRPDSFNYMLLWANTFEQGILTINSILLELTVLNFILGIPQIMEIFNLSPIGLLTIMPFIACLLTISYIRQKVTPTINSMPLQEVNDEILVWSIILGAVSILFSGTGLYLLGISIFIFIYKGLVAEIQKKAQIRTINKVNRNVKSSKKPVSIDKEPEIKEDIVKQPSVKEKEPISEKQLPRYAT